MKRTIVMCLEDLVKNLQTIASSSRKCPRCAQKSIRDPLMLHLTTLHLVCAVFQLLLNEHTII